MPMDVRQALGLPKSSKLNIRPPMKGALDKLKNVPVDIEPIYPLAR